VEDLSERSERGNLVVAGDIFMMAGVAVLARNMAGSNNVGRARS
jgi:hypothetical protein